MDFHYIFSTDLFSLDQTIASRLIHERTSANHPGLPKK